MKEQNKWLVPAILIFMVVCLFTFRHHKKIVVSEEMPMVEQDIEASKGKPAVAAPQPQAAKSKAQAPVEVASSSEAADASVDAEAKKQYLSTHKIFRSK